MGKYVQLGFGFVQDVNGQTEHKTNPKKDKSNEKKKNLNLIDKSKRLRDGAQRERKTCSQTGGG